MASEKLHECTTYQKAGRDEWVERFKRRVYLYNRDTDEVIVQEFSGRQDTRNPRSDYERLEATRSVAKDKLPSKVQEKLRQMK